MEHHVEKSEACVLFSLKSRDQWECFKSLCFYI
ncbi:hypothetical protein KSS87_001782 [Heliosperma pusillum]|nr:hypothetical protein KSS87_001782 [Heliosperma pusillum]